MKNQFWNRHRRATQIGLFALVMAAFPIFDQSAYHLAIMIQIGIFAIVVIGLNLVMGYAGQISLGHAAFYGLGAYASAMLTVHLNVYPWLAMIVGAVLTGLVAFLIGTPILRLKGHYLAMATLGFGVIVHLAFKEFFKELTGGPTGLPGVPRLTIGAFVFDNDVKYYYLVWLFVVVILTLALNIVDSRVGRALRSIHSSEIAAETLGVDTARYKLQVLVVSAVFASLAGSLRTHYNLHVSPASFTFISSVELVIMAAVGGLASIWGAPFGTGVVHLIRPLMREMMPRLLNFRSGEHELIAYGVILVVIMIFTPQGLVVGMAQAYQRWRARVAQGLAPWRRKNMYQPDLEAMSRTALEALQLRRLKDTLRRIHANNPRYVAHLQGLDQDDVPDLDALRRLPFMTKDDLRDAYPFGLACVPQSRFMRMHMSSGTTGTPIICPHTPNDVRQWGEIMARCLTAAGLGREDVLQITPSFGLFNGGFGFHYGASALETMIIPIGAGRTKLQLQFMRDLGTTAIAAIASYPLRLMEVAAREGFDFRRDSRLRVGIFGAEIWSDELRQRIEDEMGIETFDIIGMTETAGVGMGIDCAAHNGIHVWEDHYLIEFVDPDTDEPVADGEWGEMVVTTLTREALPLIRFRTRDISRVVGREPCACGRTSLRVDRIACRTDDMLKVKGVNFYPRQVESLLLSHPEVGNDYLIEIDRVEGSDHLKLNVETDQPDAESLARQLDDELYNLLGLHAEVNVVRPGELPRPPGKAVRVEDSRVVG